MALIDRWGMHEELGADALLSDNGQSVDLPPDHDTVFTVIVDSPQDLGRNVLQKGNGQAVGPFDFALEGTLTQMTFSFRLAVGANFFDSGRRAEPIKQTESTNAYFEYTIHDSVIGLVIGNAEEILIGSVSDQEFHEHKIVVDEVDVSVYFDSVEILRMARDDPDMEWPETFGIYGMQIGLPTIYDDHNSRYYYLSDLTLYDSSVVEPVIALPEILMPMSLPRFLSAGHSQTRQSIYSNAEVGAGTLSKRPMATRGSRVVNVSQMLTNSQAETHEGWYHFSLEVGAKHFAARVASTDAKADAWFDAVWVAPPRYDPRGANHWFMSGQIRVFGEASSIPPPNTSAAVAFSLPLTGHASAAISGNASVAFGLPLESFSTGASVAFTLVLEPGFLGLRRVTSAGDVRVTSDGDTRIIS